MDARPILATLAKVFAEHGLEALLIGNAAAALQGAPVTTLDFDFLFRKTPGNLRKLKAVAAGLGAVILRPYYPLSDLFRMVRDEDTLQVDFMGTIHGVKSFEGVRRRARTFDFGGCGLAVADLADIVRSKGAEGKGRGRKARLEALKRESDLALRDQIQRLLQLPPEKRTHFLRKKVGFRASCL